MALFALLFILRGVRASVITVCANGGDYATIGAAIQAASAGDLLSICAGTYAENLVINQSLILDGDAMGSVFVDGQSLGRVVTIGPSAVVTLRNMTLRNGLIQDDNGGGIYNAGDLTVETSTIFNNRARNTGAGGQAGGGIYNVGTLLMNNSLVLENRTEQTASLVDSASQGGGIYNGGNARIAESTIRGNQTGGQGGGIYNQGDLQVEMAEINANGLETSQGGGIFSIGVLELSDVVVHDNLAFSEGGLSLAGSALIQRSTIYNHNAPLAPAIGIADGAQTVSIVNSTISGNLSNHPVLQGAVVALGGQLEIKNSTFANNQGGNLYGSGLISNAILVSDEGGVNCAGDAPVSAGHNLESGDSCGFTQSTDLQNANADLLPLEQNAAGITPLHGLGASSQAIDAGDCSNGTITIDQRGEPRPQGAACDIGSYEKSQLAPPPPTEEPLTPTPAGTLPATPVPTTPTPFPTIAPNSDLFGGRVWNDLNGDGLQTIGEPGIVDVQINLVLASSGANMSSTRTDNNGFYRFNTPRTETRPLILGVALASLPPALVQTFDNDGVLDNKTLRKRDETGLFTMTDFGYMAAPPLPTGQIGGRVWLDANQNGTKDADEISLPNVQVNLVRPADGSFLASTQTGSDGAYLFDQLPPRDYMVGIARSSLPPSLAPIFDNDGQLDNKFAFSLADGEVAPAVLFGYRTTSTMSNPEIVEAEAKASTIELAFLPLAMR